ncbi:MAG TPA: hypothetical protein VFK40_14160 [Nitrososphaeraceae archaeon]|nr:hypothetical protein [Nitrososphaeraceae archaeon]
MINIEIKDHNSKTIDLIPSNLHEPIALITKVKGFDNIDDYVIDILKRELESLREEMLQQILVNQLLNICRI